MRRRRRCPRPAAGRLSPLPRRPPRPFHSFAEKHSRSPIGLSWGGTSPPEIARTLAPSAFYEAAFARCYSGENPRVSVPVGGGRFAGEAGPPAPARPPVTGTRRQPPPRSTPPPGAPGDVPTRGSRPSGRRRGRCPRCAPARASAAGGVGAGAGRGRGGFATSGRGAGGGRGGVGTPALDPAPPSRIPAADAGGAASRGAGAGSPGRGGTLAPRGRAEGAGPPPPTPPPRRGAAAAAI